MKKLLTLSCAAIILTGALLAEDAPAKPVASGCEPNTKQEMQSPPAKEQKQNKKEKQKKEKTNGEPQNNDWLRATFG